MVINKEKQVNASTILDREVYAKLKDVARKNKRSVSAQIYMYIEEGLSREKR